MYDVDRDRDGLPLLFESNRKTGKATDRFNPDCEWVRWEDNVSARDEHTGRSVQINARWWDTVRDFMLNHDHRVVVFTNNSTGQQCRVYRTDFEGTV